LNVNLDKNFEILDIDLVARTISNIQAAAILLLRGMNPQTQAMLRNSLESLFALVAIAKNPSFADKLIAQHPRAQKRMLLNAQRWTAPELQEQAKAKATDERLKEIEAALQNPESGCYM